MACTPEKREESRAERFKQEDGDDPRPEAELPPILYGDHLAEYFFEVGPAPGGDALTHTELRNWQDNTGVELDAFESQTLSAMSRAYLGMLHEARKPSCPWPAKRELTPAEKVAQAKRMKRRIRKESE